MIATVYTTAGGRRFHADSFCLALAVGREFHAARAGNAHPIGLYRLVQQGVGTAAAAGYTACRVCVPPALALPATGETYGHRPIGGLVDVCARCTVNVAYWLGTPDENDGWIVLPTAVAWPCTSAVVLGLAPHVDPL